jgi:uncharacterized delta-60 repeat protein
MTEQTHERAESKMILRDKKPRGRVAVLIASMLSVLIAASTVLAAPGGLDKTFSQDGKATAYVNNSHHEGQDVAVQENGRVILAGIVDNGATATRFKADGTLDDGFGQAGHFTADFPGEDDSYAEKVVIDGQGRSLIGVFTYSDVSQSYDFGVVRLKTDGTPDDTFSQDGYAVVEVLDDTEYLYDMALAPGGKIVLGGVSEGPDGGLAAVARLKSNGMPDDTFGGGDGFRTYDFGGAVPNGIAASVLVRESGKILLGIREDEFNTLTDFVLAELNEDGSPSTGFANDGVRFLDFAGSEDLPNEMAWQGDRIVMVGSAQDAAGNQDWALARFKSNGAIDTNFSGDGRVMMHVFTDSADEIMDVEVQGDDRIVVAGNYAEGGNMTVARFKASGGLDKTFSGDGFSYIKFPMGSRANGLDLQGDRIVVGGDTNGLPGMSTSLAVAALKRT